MRKTFLLDLIFIISFSAQSQLAVSKIIVRIRKIIKLVLGYLVIMNTL